MEKSQNESNQWEQSKENIQPLKQGRRATVLSVVLDENATQKLNIRRHEFEEELRTYSGDDPLSVWYEYVLWVEQNYPKGGKEGKLTRLIKKCLMAMYSNADLQEKYVNDQRFLDIWIKYANLSTNPLEVYQTMEGRCLCLYLADFYINWAWEMEKAGSFKQAEAIYEKGLHVGAKPISSLQDAQKKFQIRVARSTIEGRVSDQAVNSSEQERMALASLKPQGHKATVNRTGSALVGPAGHCHQEVSVKKHAGPAFPIFRDTSTSGHTTSAPSDENQSALGLGLPTNQENIMKTSHWTKAKFHQKTVDVVPVEDIEKYQRPKFSVHEDETPALQRENQTRPSHASHVLSVHKEYEKWDVQLFIPEPFDPKVQPQYCKHKVYCGTEEFSFEELRAARYTKKERERKEKEVERAKMQNWLKNQEDKLKNQDDKLKNQDDRLKQQEELIKQLFKKMEKESKQDIQLKSSHIYQDSWLTIERSAGVSVNASNLLDESAQAVLQCEPPAAIECIKEPTTNSDPSPYIIISPSTQEHGNLSTSGNSRRLSFIDPTGDATNIVNDIWSASLSHSTSQQLTERGVELEPASNEASAFLSNEDGSKGLQLLGEDRATPFPIFSDPVNQEKKTGMLEIPQSARALQEREATETKTAEPAGTELVESAAAETEDCPEKQKENCPPPGMVQQPCEPRYISGILMPARDIPVMEDQECQERKDVGREADKYASGMESSYVSALKNDLDDIVPLDDGKQSEDFTIKMPNNREIFIHMAKAASTPVPGFHRLVPPTSSMKTDTSIAFGAAKNQCSLVQERENRNSPQENLELMLPPSSTKAQVTTTNAVTATSLPYLEPGAWLSPIIETSREYRSSSSSSGCSITSNTLHGYSVHGLSQPGNFSLSTAHMSHIHPHSQADQELAAESVPAIQAGDFTKSGYLADKSRGESLAEILPYTVGAAKPQTFLLSSAIAEVVLDFKDTVSSVDAEDKEMRCGSPKNINPFDEDVLQQILSELEIPLEKRGGYVRMKGNMPPLKANMQVNLGMETFHIYKMCGEGAYAKAYNAVTVDSLNVTLMPDEEDYQKQVLLKVQKPACPWEFYICHELRQRLKAAGYCQGILDSVLKIDRGYMFSNGSVLVNKYHQYGTLLDAVNRYRAVGKTFPEEIAIYFMIEILSILEAVHKCNIIHGDIKPDNFLIQAIPEKSDEILESFQRGPVSLKLIDFGRSIDMRAFPEGTTFTEVVTTEKFTCCEMMEGRPWTYQTDYYGAAAIAHLFLFGTYMDLKKTDGKWSVKGLKRYWKKDLWEMIFSTLLNVPSCSVLPDLKAINQEIKRTFNEAGMHNDIILKFRYFAA